MALRVYYLTKAGEEGREFASVMCEGGASFSVCKDDLSYTPLLFSLSKYCILNEHILVKRNRTGRDWAHLHIWLCVVDSNPLFYPIEIRRQIQAD